MLSGFVSSHPEKEKTLTECFEKEDWKNYKVYVHALKTNLRSIGANEISELARILEKAAESSDVSLIKEKHPILIREYEKLASDINKIFSLVFDQNSV